MAVRIGLPPLAAMFNSSGTAYAAKTGTSAIESRFVLDHSLERERKKIKCGRKSFNDALAESPALLIECDKAGKLAVQRKSPYR